MHESLQAWAMRQLEAQVKRNLPSVKLARQLKASQRESKKAWGRARRSMAASQSSSKRKLDQQLAELEKASRERREALDRELEEKRWDFIIGKK